MPAVLTASFCTCHCCDLASRRPGPPLSRLLRNPPRVHGQSGAGLCRPPRPGSAAGPGAQAAPRGTRNPSPCHPKYKQIKGKKSSRQTAGKRTEPRAQEGRCGRRPRPPRRARSWRPEHAPAAAGLGQRCPLTSCSPRWARRGRSGPRYSSRAAEPRGSGTPSSPTPHYNPQQPSRRGGKWRRPPRGLLGNVVRGGQAPGRAVSARRAAGDSPAARGRGGEGPAARARGRWQRGLIAAS